MRFEDWQQQNTALLEGDGFEAWQEENRNVIEGDPIKDVERNEVIANYYGNHPGLTLEDVGRNYEKVVADPDEPTLEPTIRSQSLLSRFGKQFINSFINLVPIDKRKENLEPYIEKAREEINQTYKGKPEYKEYAVYGRAGELASEPALPTFKIETAKGVKEKVVDVGAGLASFITQLALTRRILPPGTSEPLVWEVHNQIAGGPDGEGATMALTLGAIGKIPARTVVGKAAKVAAESSIFGTLTAIQGGGVEDILISAAIPPALKATAGFKKALIGARVYDSYINGHIEAAKHRVKARNAARAEIKDALSKGTDSPEWEAVAKKYGGWATVGEKVKTPPKDVEQLRDYGQHPIAQPTNTPGEAMFTWGAKLPELLKESQASIGLKEGKPAAPAEAAKGEKKPLAGSREAGFVDLTPLVTAGEQIKTTGEKAGKVITRFGGLEPQVEKTLIEYEEQMRELPKVIAKESIEKYGQLTPEQENAIRNYREQPKKYPKPEGMEKEYAQYEKDIAEIGEGLKELGYKADWPNQYIERLQKRLEKLESKEEPDVEMIEVLQEAIEEAKDLQYLHHYYESESAVRKFFGAFKRRISARPSGLLGREIPTYEKARELGLKPAPLAVEVAHAQFSLRRAQEADKLIKAINGNPNLALKEDEAPDGWRYLSEDIFPASVQHQAWVTEEGKAAHRRVRYKYPAPIAEALEELTYARTPHLLIDAYDKLNYGLKMIGFYNPLIMTKNDLVQGWRASGFSYGLYLPKAFKTFLQKGTEYEKLRKMGLFNNVVNWTPAATATTSTMLDKIRMTSGQKVAKAAKQWLNPANLIENINRFNNATTWKLDEIMRIACYNSIKDTTMAEGLSDFEKVVMANDFMVNYGKLPKATKEHLNRFVFVPTYRIGNFRVWFGRVMAHPWQYKGPLLRTVGYKLFVKYGLPALVMGFLSWAYGQRRKNVRTELGYRLVIPNPKTGKDTVYSLSDPLLEGAKVTQRPIGQTILNNMAALPSLIGRIAYGPRYDNPNDPLSEFFKLGTPIYREVVNWQDEDKTIPQKILTQLAIAYVYTRKEREPSEEDKKISAEALAKALSIWREWRKTQPEKTGWSK